MERKFSFHPASLVQPEPEAARLSLRHLSVSSIQVQCSSELQRRFVARPACV